jgi:cytoskeletal protein CcmA (bactofilin family)
VKAREIVISGDAFGDFVCEGPVTLMPGGTLSGSVVARSLKVHDGAELLGIFRILSGPPQSFITEIRRWHWLCRSDQRKVDCERVIFEPHGK